jgi:beta-carotene 3-hydroxylase
MHGVLWYLHKDHHQKKPGFLEKNDTFFLIFGLPVFFTLLFGFMYDIYWLHAMGFGIMAYGLTYFMIHDVIIHQRFKWFNPTDNTYIRALRWGHKMHHKHLDKQEGECFGLLFVHRKYWRKVWKDKKQSSPDLSTIS